MAHPKHRSSKQRKRKRRSHLALKSGVSNLVECQNCGEHHERHRVCKECGHYRGRQVLNV